MKNLINADDFRSLGRAAGVGFSTLLRALQPSDAGRRVSGHWDHLTAVADSWYSIPAVQKNWNRLISGDERTDHRQWTSARFMRGQTGLTMLAPGCGTGHAEIAWAQTGHFARIDGWDISEVRLQMARESAREAGTDSITQFENRDVMNAQVPDHTYDMIVFEHALHHFQPVSRVLDRVLRWLKPDGRLIINEFTGPNRFQWSRAQLQEINRLLLTIPVPCRTLPDGRIKQRVIAPSLLRMWLTDPSEAADAAAILHEIHARCKVLTEKPYGGTVLHPLLHQIARHFRDASGDCASVLEMLIREETVLIRDGVLASDFCFGVYENRADAAGTAWHSDGDPG